MYVYDAYAQYTIPRLSTSTLNLESSFSSSNFYHNNILWLHYAILYTRDAEYNYAYDWNVLTKFDSLLFYGD